MIIEYKMNKVPAKECFKHMNEYRFLNYSDKVEGQVYSRQEFIDWIGPLPDISSEGESILPGQGDINWFGLEISIKEIPMITPGIIRFVLK